MPEGVRTARPPSTPVPTSPWTGLRWLHPSPPTVALVLPGSEKLVIKIAPSAYGPPWPTSLGSVTGIIGSHCHL